MKYEKEIEMLMKDFSAHYVTQELCIPLGDGWTLDDMKNISIEIDSNVSALIRHNPKDRSSVYLGGKLLQKPKYKNEDLDSWLGIKALLRIQEFLKGKPIKRFNSRTLDIVACVLGYQGGFYGYLQGKRRDP